MLHQFVRNTWVVVVLASASFGTACSSGPNAPDDSDADTSADAPHADDVDVSDRNDAGGDASAPDAATLSCTLDEPCQGSQACYRDDGGTYHQCTCSGGKLACMDVPAGPPTTCVAGGACPTDGAICAADDGMTAGYCTCTTNQWACLQTPGSSQSCSVTDACQFPQFGATTWIGCFSRSTTGASSAGVLCTEANGGIDSNGVSFQRVCPAATPTTGTICDATDPTGSSPMEIQGVYCGCKEPNGSSCVCACRRAGPNTPLGWLCMP